MHVLGPLLFVMSAQSPAAAPASPLLLDRTGIRWVVPFDTARQTARDRHRLLLIKPIAFGTTRKGNW